MDLWILFSKRTENTIAHVHIWNTQIKKLKSNYTPKKKI